MESLGLSGTYFSDQVAPEKHPKSKSKDELEDFCAFLGFKSEMCSTKNTNDTQCRDLLKIDVEKEMKDALKASASNTKISLNQKRKANKAAREKEKGKEWFNLPATEMTEEVKNDLKILQMRSALDPKHFYKKNDLKVLPRYFQVGKYLDSPLDYHQEKHLKKNKSKTIVEDLLKDAEFQKKIKRKYNEIAAKEKPYFRHRKNHDRKRGNERKKK
uniref:Putative fcf2 pre-rrna processing n=1 Tax=Lutzomyia longipalpis TaxID=7200 RepID=A0A1B0GI89_LUTLO